MGSLVCVGTGLQLAGQVSVMSRSYIEHADVVFSLLPDGFSQRWIQNINPNVINLQPFYAQNGEVKNRRETYEQMVNSILEAVRAGKKNRLCALWSSWSLCLCFPYGDYAGEGRRVFSEDGAGDFCRGVFMG